MTKRKFIYLCGFILGFFIIYFVNLLIGNSIIINILTPIGSISAFCSLFYAALKSKNNRSKYAFLSLGCFIWIICDILIAYGEMFLKIPTEAHVLYNILIVDMSFVIDIMIAIALVITYISRKKQMYYFQLFWDNMAITLCSLGFLWIIFLKDHYNKILALNFDIIASFLFICINIFILTILFSIYLSSKNSVITIKYKFIMFGIIVNSLTDLIQALLLQYVVNKVTYTAYMISLLCLAIGAILEVYEPLNAKKKVRSEIYSNVGNVRLGLSLFIVPIFIIILKGFNLYELLYFSMVIFIYNIMSKYIQNSAKIQYLLDKEKKITEKYKLLAKAIEQSPVAISITDENGNIEFINPRFSQLTGFSKEEVMGKNLRIARSNKFDTKVLKELWDTIQSGKTWKGEFIDEKKNGEEYFGEIIAEPIKNSQDIITNYIFINEDITEIKKANRTILDQLYFLTQLIDAVPSPMFYEAIDKCILGCNKAFEDAFGVKREDIIGKSIKEIDDLSDFDDIKDGSDSLSPIKIRFADGKIHQLLYQKSEFKLSDSISGGMIGTMVDITELKEKEIELLNEKNFLNAVFNNIPAIIYVKDAKTLSFVKINKKALDYVGKTEEEVKNCYDHDLFPEELAKKFGETDRKVIETGTPVTEIEILPGNEKYKMRYVKATKTSVLDTEGKPLYLLGMSEDISEIKEKEEALNQAVLIAQEATQAKSMFLANMSHEIRTPMNAIIGMAYLALQTDLTDKQRDYILKIHNAGTSLLGIINGILDFSKIESGKLNLEYTNFNIEEVMSNVYDIINSNAYNKGIEFLSYINPDIPQNLVGDSLRLGQVIINLLSNAVKFTDKGEVSIDIEKINETGDKVELQFKIKDTGIGMTEEQIHKLFEAFTQADGSTTRKYGGTGLGLTISKKLVEMMGGTIRVESEYGKGTTFTFTAPFNISKTNEKRVIPKDLNNVHILVVDDNLFAREIMGEYLTTLGFRADIVSSGEKAILAVKKCDNDDPYAAIFMDWQMPDINGINTAYIIKSSNDIKNTPHIVIVSAFESEDVRRKTEEAKLDGYLIKPVNQSIICNCLTNILSEDSERISQIKVHNEIDYKLSGIRLLLAEDNEINRQIVSEILQSQGIIIDTVLNGKDAVFKVKQRNYDIVLMDLQMPVMDGFEATKLIRENDKNIPIIAMTARTIIEERQRCIREGMNDHISKPIDPHILFSTIHKWLSEYKKNELLMIHKEISENKELIGENTEIPAILGVDVKYGLKHVVNNSSLYKGLLIKYAEEESNEVNELKNAVDVLDFDAAKKIVHKLKGVSGNIGAFEMQTYSANIEKVLDSGEKSENIQNMILKLETMINDTSNSIKETFNSDTYINIAHDEVGLTIIRECIKKIKTLLMDNDSEAVYYFNSQRNTFLKCFRKRQIKSLETSLNDFDFDKALLIIEEYNLGNDEKNEGIRYE